MSSKNFKRTKYACFFTYVAMASAFSLPPMLFVTFRDMYGISYTLLGTLVLVNFCTQLGIDLIFSFFTKYFNIHLTLKIMPLLTTAGLTVYALVPFFFPQIAYLGLLTGTVLFSVAAGLSEVLLSPLVAAIPSDHPEKDMSLLHSLYAWGVVTVVLVSTLFFTVFGRENWMYLTLFWATLPLISCFMYCTSPLPEMNVSGDGGAGGTKKRGMGLALCVLCIFLGSAAENSMTNWISGYMENALNVPKALGDVLGMAMFAILLGLGRTLHARYGGNISTILLCSMIGASACYLVAGLSPNVILSFIACILMGFFTSMLWPGALILMEEKIPAAGVAAYALMAAGGDFGASVAPQLLGVVVDKVSESAFAANLSATASMSVEQIGMKAGMLMASVFPILGIFVLIYIKNYFKKKAK